MPLPEPRVYAPEDRPDVEVLVEVPGAEPVWCPGELRQWKPVREADGEVVWVAQVQFRSPGEHSSAIGDFTVEQVRPDTVDRSQGRCG